MAASRDSLNTPAETDNFPGDERPLSPGWYIALLKNNWLASSQLVIASVLTQLFALGLPFFYIVIFDRVFGRNNLATLDVLTIGMVLVLVFDVIVKSLRSALTAHLTNWLDERTTDTLLKRLFYTPLKSGVQILPDRFGDLIRLNQSALPLFALYALDVVFSLLVVLVLFFLHPVMAAVSLVALVPLTLYALWHTPRARRRQERTTVELKQCQASLRETAIHMDSLRAMNAGERARQRLAQKVEAFIDNSYGSRVDGASGSNVPGFFINLGSVLTLYVGARLVLAGEMSFGVYLAINMISRIVLSSFQRFLQAFLQYQQAASEREAIAEILALPLTQPSDNSRQIQLPRLSGEIRFHNVSYRYEADTPWILDGLDLTIRAGERVVITGGSGSGKSTLINLLTRLSEPNQGQILLDGYHLEDIDSSSLRSRIGLVPQRPVLMAGTLRENLLLGAPEASARDLADAVQWAGLEKWLALQPDGLDSEVRPLGINIPGAVAAQIAMARLYLREDVDLVVVDEALSSLPPGVRIHLINALHKRYRDKTCLFVSGFIPLHQSVDRILVLEDGQVAEEGSFRELAGRKTSYHQLFHTGGGA